MKARWITSLVLLVAFALRGLEILAEPAYLHPDAVFQGLEPAFDLVWGGGWLPWEFQQGLRSWVWPGLLAGPMALARVLGAAGPGEGMAWAIAGARACVALIDVLGIALAMQILALRGSQVTAWLGGGVLAVHPAFVVMGAQPLIDVPAAVAVLWACRWALAPVDRPLRAFMLGSGIGAVAMLRLQLLPAVAVLTVAAVLNLIRATLPSAMKARHRGALVAAGIAGFGLCLGIFGAVDWWAWGRPWHSLLAYAEFHFSPRRTSFGEMPANQYWNGFIDAWGSLRFGLLLAAIVGLRRSKLVGFVLLAIVVPHQWVEVRVWRFLHPALPLLVILAAWGVEVSARPWWANHRRKVALAGTVLVWWLVASVVAANRGIWRTTWLYNQGGMTAVELSRGLNLAYLELSRRAAPQGVLQSVLPQVAAPGRALLGHDVTIVHTVGRRPPETSLWTHAIVGPALQPAAVAAGLVVAWEEPGSGVQIMTAPAGLDHRLRETN